MPRADEKNEFPARPGARGRGALGWIPADAPALRAARGYYLLRQWPAAAAAVEGTPDLPGAGVILSLARARLCERDAARDAFAAAVAMAPEEPHLRCARAAFLLRDGHGVPALADAEAGLAHADHRSPLGTALLSLVGAARWRLGQEAMGRGEERRAVSEFDHAARAFRAAAAGRRATAERLAAAYVGQAVAMVAAGQIEAVPRLFARRQAEGMSPSPSLARFARDLYELCDLAARLPDAERSVVGEALRPVLAVAALQVSLWDGGYPVLLGWHGLPGGDASP